MFIDKFRDREFHEKGQGETDQCWEENTHNKPTTARQVFALNKLTKSKRKINKIHADIASMCILQ